MKNIYNLVLVLLGMVVFTTSCQDDMHELGRKLDKSEIQFRVEQPLNIDEGGNTVVLINETPETVAMWDYGTGRSNRRVDTVRFPFKGEYTIQFSALTAGGVVAMDPVTVTVTEDNFDYIKDPLWTALTGGVGKEKTWILDYGNHGMFDGPLYYYEPKTTWEDFQNGTAKLGWAPSWKGNEWIISEADMESTMTFSLQNGAFLTTHKVGEGVDESGTFYLDAPNKTLSTTDATILRSPNFIANASNWNENLVILSLTENKLQVGVRRTNEEGDYLYVWNYISQEYAENYVPSGPEPDPNFDFGDDQKDILAVDKTTTKTWKLDTEVPFNWTNLEGGFLNDWNTRSDFPEWTSYDDAAVANIDDASISFSEDGTVVITNDDGTIQEGTYEIDETTNIITFTGVTPDILIAGNISATTTEENQWKIVKVDRNEVTDKVTGIWFGKRNPEMAEYMVFHFKLQVAGAAEPTPEELIMNTIAGTDSKTWQLDEQVPFDWTDLQGNFLNGFASRADYPDWTKFGDSHVEAMNDASIQFNTDGTVVVTQDDGTTSEGTFTIDGLPKEIIFQDITPAIPIGEWVVAEPTAENVWKIILVERDANKEPTGIWFGKRDPAKDEYMVFHFVLN